MSNAFANIDEDFKLKGVPGDLWNLASGLYKGVNAENDAAFIDALGSFAKGGVGMATNLIGAAGPVGGGLEGLIDVGTGLYDCVQSFDQLGEGGAFNDDGHRNAFWGGAGDATLGGAHTLINACALAGPEAAPIVMALDMALGAGEMGANVTGGAIGLLGEWLEKRTGDEHDWAFDAGDLVGGLEHGAFSAASSTLGAIQHGGVGAAAAAGGGALLGGGAGLALSLATGGLLSPLAPILAATGGALGANLADKGIMGTAQSIIDWF